MNEFDTMLRKSKKERDALVSKRNTLDHQIAALNKTIEGLSQLCRPMPEKPAAVSSLEKEMLKHAGLADVVRMALQATTDAPLTSNDIVVLLKLISYPIERLDNPRASVNVILSRLVTNGEAERMPEGNNVRYAWIKKTTDTKAPREKGSSLDQYLQDVLAHEAGRKK